MRACAGVRARDIELHTSRGGDCVTGARTAPGSHLLPREQSIHLVKQFIYATYAMMQLRILAKYRQS